MTDDSRPLDLLRRAFDAAVAAADPRSVVAEHAPPAPRGRIVVVGAGKAAAAMAAGVEDAYRGTRAWGRLGGLVITRDGHGAPTERVEVVEAGHPVPDARGAGATERVLDLVRDAGEHDLVIALVSGGGSALLTAPAGVTLAEKQQLSRDLLSSGATIHEMNAVRKHLSRVKGGLLGAAAHPAPVLALILSDVVGDDLDVVASGPTVGDRSSFADALAVLERYGIGAGAARSRIAAGARGDHEETPGPGDSRLARVRNVLVGSNQRSLEAAAAVVREAGYRDLILSSAITGEARVVGAVHAAVAWQAVQHGQPCPAPCALVSGGETTVTVRGDGRGGRNSEFALGFALELGPERLGSGRVHALAADTDGIDGSEANAGVFVSPRLFAAVDAHEARRAADANDSWRVFAEAGLLLQTGATRTNVNDLRIVLIDPAREPEREA